ncbi:MAG: hypothetical protein JW834_03355 [Candidatus Diapherotrites archaeon]|nr:hypothetical protein [Candidatus Diapherotrites archaeon]
MPKHETIFRMRVGVPHTHPQAKERAVARLNTLLNQAKNSKGNLLALESAETEAGRKLARLHEAEYVDSTNEMRELVSAVDALLRGVNTNAYKAMLETPQTQGKAKPL